MWLWRWQYISHTRRKTHRKAHNSSVHQNSCDILQPETQILIISIFLRENRCSRNHIVVVKVNEQLQHLMFTAKCLYIFKATTWLDLIPISYQYQDIFCISCFHSWITLLASGTMYSMSRVLTLSILGEELSSFAITQ